MGTQSDQLEQQARQARAGMSDTIEELRARMTPGQVIDQLGEYVREGPPAEFVQNLGREIVENPLPLTLLAVAVAWLVIGGSRSSRARAEQEAAIKVAEIYARETAGNRAVPQGIPPLPVAGPGYADERADDVLIPEIGDTGHRAALQDARGVEQIDEQR